MFFRRIQIRIVFVDRISFKKLIIIIIYVRCVQSYKKYRLFSLFKKCVKCIRVDKRYDFVISIVDFFDIDKILKKLKGEKLKIEKI